MIDLNDVRNSAARLVAYVDADTASGGPDAILANRPYLAELLRDLRVAVARDEDRERVAAYERSREES